MPFHPGSRPARKILLFGPQALSFDIESFNKLRIQLYEAPGNHWILDTVSTLSGIWGTLIKDVPRLQHFGGEQLLQKLSEALNTGTLLPSLFPLPNVLLTPLVVIAHLVQYSAFLKAALPDIADTDELPPSMTNGTETLGLCTGMLSMFAVGCSSNLAKLQYYGPVAIRLAMLIGALVDAEDASSDLDGSSVSLSVLWKSTQLNLNEVLEKFSGVRRTLRFVIHRLM